MALQIRAYDPNLLEGMIDLYNRETAFEPHIAPLTVDIFARLVATKACFDPAGLAIAVEDGKVIGWAHACVAAGSEAWHNGTETIPQIRMLLFSRNRLDVGAALLAEATRWLEKAGQPRLLALSSEKGYPLYRGLWLGGEPMGPATMPHVQIALAAAGYKTSAESIFMTAHMTAAPTLPKTEPGAELVDSPAKMAHESMADSWIGFSPQTTKLMLGDESAGDIGWTILPHVAAKLGAPALNIWSLGVPEKHRRKGFGSLLTAHVLTRGYAQGARFASVGTQVWNAPAHGTYAKFGFTPHCIMIARARQP